MCEVLNGKPQTTKPEAVNDQESAFPEGTIFSLLEITVCELKGLDNGHLPGELTYMKMSFTNTF